MTARIKPFVFASVLLAAVSHHAAAQEWSQWRGPNRDAVAKDFDAPAGWPEKLSLRWKVYSGGGYSSPVVADGRVFLHARAGDEETVAAYDLPTGRALWSSRYRSPSGKSAEYARSEGEGPYATPSVADGRLYTLGINGVLSAFDARTGALRWRRDFSERLVSRTRFCGTAASPLVAAGLVVVQVGDDRAGALVALDAADGRVRWTLASDAPGYASPVVADFGGERQLVAVTDEAVVGVSLKSGRQLWSAPYRSDKSGCSQNTVTPVVYGGRVVVSAYGRGTTALSVAREGGAWRVKQDWHNPSVSMHLSGAALASGRLYGLSHTRRGQLFCLDAATGQTLWATEGRAGERTAVVAAGGLLLMLTGEGELIVARAAAERFEQLARYRVSDGAVWAYPAPAGRHLVVRDDSTLSVWATH